MKLTRRNGTSTYSPGVTPERPTEPEGPIDRLEARRQNYTINPPPAERTYLVPSAVGQRGGAWLRSDREESYLFM